MRNRIPLVILSLSLAAGMVVATSAVPARADNLIIGDDFQVDDLMPPTSYDVYYHNIGSDNDGHVYYAWLEAIYANPASHRLRFRSSSDFGKSFDDDPIAIPVTPAPNGLSEIQMCNDNNGNVYIAWIYNIGFAGDRRIYFTRSTDYGATWPEHDKRIDTATTPKSIPLPPRIACDDKGSVYLIWQDSRSGSMHIYFNSSTDYGATWQLHDVQIDHAGDGRDAGSPQACADTKGRVYVVWSDRRMGIYRLFLNYSLDYGATWASEDVRVDHNRTGLYYQLEDQKIACDADGHVYVAWRDLRQAGGWHVYANHSSDCGATWEEEDQRLDNSVTPIHAAPIALASASKGHVYALWQAGVSPFTNASKVFFNSSSDYGASWSDAATRLDSAPPNYQAHFSKLASDDDGSLYVTWVQEPYCSPRCINAQNIYFNYSANNGDDWLPEGLRLDSAPDDTSQDQPIIAADEAGHAYVAWHDNRNAPVFGNPLINYFSVAITVSTEK